MKILTRRFVTTTPVSKELREEIRKQEKLLYIPGRLTVETKFATIPNVLEGIELESDEDIEEQWLAKKIADPRYDVCHLHLTDAEWKKVKLRPTLYGSSELVKGQVITYGRWHAKSTYTFAYKYPEPVKSMGELSIGWWHEMDHGFRRLFNMDSAHTHYYFYGYDRKYSKAEELALKPKRWQRVPDPLVGWALLPWPQGLLPVVDRKSKALVSLCASQGCPIRITEGYRSIERQNELYAQGRTKPGPIVTNARGGESYHNWGCAFDIVPLEGYTSTKWNKIGVLGESLGFVWGGRWAFQDKPHFELTHGYSFRDFINGRVDYSKFS